MLKVVGTGSAGNCYILQAREEKLILEAGMSIKDIKKALDFDLTDVKGCLITHSHKDHYKAIREVLNSGIDIYTSKGTINDIGQDRHHRINYVANKEQKKIGNFNVLFFEVEHDTTEPLGFLIQHKDLGKILFATDTYSLKYKFKGVNHIVIECNYIEELATEEDLRLLKSHMSLETLKKILPTWDLSETKDITLIHLSSRHCEADRCKREIEELTGIKTFIANKGEELWT